MENITIEHLLSFIGRDMKNDSKINAMIALRKEITKIEKARDEAESTIKAILNLIN